MIPVRRLHHRFVPLLVLALLLVLLPFEPVVAQASTPETKAAIIEDLSLLAADEQTADAGAATAAPQASEDEGPATEAADDEGPATEAAEDEVPATEAPSTEVPVTDVPVEPGSDTQVDVVAQRSEVNEAPFAFSGLGFRGDGAPPELHYRVSDPAGTWTVWEPVAYADEFDGPDEGSPEAAVATTSDWVSEPIWVGEATHLQLDARGADLGEIETSVIDTMGLSETLFRRISRHAGSLGTAPAAAALSRPAILSRSAWGANESWAWRSGSPSYRTPQSAVLHHTATSNTYTPAQAAGQVRNMYHWHTIGGNGWSDIGYNFIVDRFGTVYEGRRGGITKGVVGAHAGGWNTGTFGVAIMGNHNTVAASSAAFGSASRLIAWKFDLHGIDPDPSARVSMNGHRIRTIEGHRNVRGSYVAESRSSGFQTDCPGKLLYPRMGELRNDVFARLASWTPVVGDWNGDGRTTPGWFHEGAWRLRNSNSGGEPDVLVNYGQAGDLPVVGDWDGDGTTTIGLVRDGHWLLRNSNVAGWSDAAFWFGRGSIDHPMAGDWNGDGRDTPAIVRDGEWHLRNRLSGGSGQIVFSYGRITRGDIPIVGDWNGNGRDTPGILRDGEWHLRNSHSGGSANVMFTYGRVTRGDAPIVGDWIRDGRTTVGVTRGGAWHLRNSLSAGSADAGFVYQ